MIHWGWALAAFMAGGILGILIMGIMAAASESSRRDEKSGREEKG